jgi:hypothetical protein
LALKSGERAYSSRFQLKRLDEGEPLEICYPLVEEWNYSTGARVENPLEVVRAEVEDTLGKTYRRRLSHEDIQKITSAWTPEMARFVNAQGEQWTIGFH